MTVMSKQAGKLVMRGMYASDKDNAAFLEGRQLCQQVNLDLLNAPLEKVVVYLDPSEFKSTWIGNKSNLSHAHGHGGQRSFNYPRAGFERVR